MGDMKKEEPAEKEEEAVYDEEKEQINRRYGYLGISGEGRCFDVLS